MKINEMTCCMVIVCDGCTSDKGFSYGYLGFKSYCTIVGARVFNENVKQCGFEVNERGSLKPICKLC